MHSSSNSSTGVDCHLDENKSHTHARKWSSATTSSCSTDSSKESTSSIDGSGLMRTRGGNGQRFSKLLPHTPCIRGGSSVVQRNVRQAIPRLCFWNPQPQEMK